MAHLLPPDKLNRFKRRFEELDIENDNKLSREAVAQILSEQAPQLERLMVAILFEKYDKNKDSYIQLDEYLEFCAEMSNLTETEILRKIFDICDKDHNQKLDVNEVKSLGEAMGIDVSELDAWATIHELDANNDNTIDFEEFCRIIQP